jgi:hypothetical protein
MAATILLTEFLLLSKLPCFVPNWTEEQQQQQQQQQ